MYSINKNTVFYCLIFVVFVYHSCYSEDGDLDPTFNGTGMVTTSFGVGSLEDGLGLAIQSDGKIIVAGLSNAGGSVDFALARYNTNGSLDTTFGTNGLVTTNFGGSETANAVVIQPDGKIIAVGETTAGGGSNNFALARYNTDGSLDTTFGTNGLVITNFSGSSIDVANAVVLQPDGKIIAVGQTTAGGENNNFGLARYNTDGSLDTTFGTNGLVITLVGNVDIANAAALQPDGKIIAVGQTNVGGTNDFALARYNTDGSLDTTFGINGIVITILGGPNIARAVVLQPDGKIIVAGNSIGDFALARYNTNGSLDTTFGTNGFVTTDFGGTDVASGVILQPNGKIVAAGRSNGLGNDNFALARYNTDGSLDETFGGDGKVLTIFVSGASRANAVALQADGKIVAAGESPLTGGTDFAVARYENPGFNVIGSDSVLTLFTTPQIVSNIRFAKLAMLRGGFGLYGNVIFDSCFPITGTVCLECFTLTMEQDIVMNNISYLGSLGNIVGNGHMLELAQSITVIPNLVCEEPNISPAELCPHVEWENLVVSLNSDVVLLNTEVMFTGNSVLKGNGNILTLDDASALIVGEDAQLTMQNITIDGVHGNNIRCVNDQSQLVLENVQWNLDAQYTFTIGRLKISKDFYINGTDKIFSYQSNQVSSIETNGRLIVGPKVEFNYAPSMALQNLLSLVDSSSQLILKGSTLRVSSVGINLLKGILKIARDSSLVSEGVNVSEGIHLGDGNNSNNNIDVQIMPAAQLFITGPVIYQNV